MFSSFFVMCMHKFLIPTMLSKQILLSLTTASFIKPNFVYRRRFVNKHAISIEFVFDIEFLISLKMTIANAINYGIIVSIMNHCLKKTIKDDMKLRRNITG